MLSRRHFLSLLAAAPAAAQVEQLQRRGPSQHVIIVGAGLAGLCAGYELRQQGHQVTILEAQMRPGGRVRTLRERFAPGLYVEAGAESIPSSHELTRHYAAAFGLTLAPAWVDGKRSFYHVHDRRVVPEIRRSGLSI